MPLPRLARNLAGAAFLALVASAPAHAYDGPVEKKTFTLPSYTTAGGRTIANVRVGYETYGKLNAAGDNAIFIAHFYSGRKQISKMKTKLSALALPVSAASTQSSRRSSTK